MKLGSVVKFYADELRHGRKAPSLFVEALEVFARQSGGDVFRHPTNGQSIYYVPPNLRLVFWFNWEGALPKKVSVMPYVARRSVSTAQLEEGFTSVGSEVEWVWFSRVTKSRLTSYDVKFLASLDKYTFQARAVGHKQESSSGPLSRREAVVALARSLEADLTAVGETILRMSDAELKKLAY